MGRNSRNPSEYSTKWLESSAKYSSSVQSSLGGKEPGDLPRRVPARPVAGSVFAAFFSDPSPWFAASLRGDRRSRADARRRLDLSTDSILTMPIAAVERLEVAHVGRVGRAEGVVVDRPARGVLGVAVAVLFDQPVQELEEVPGRAQVAQGVLEIVVADRVVDEPAEAGGVAVAADGSGWQARRRSLARS